MNQEVLRRPTWLDPIFNADVEETMKTGVFLAVEKWLKSQTGLELKSLVWVITFLIPVTKYGSDTIQWLRSNASSSITLEMRTLAAANLQDGISKQPPNAPFSWIPAFENLEMKNSPTNSVALGRQNTYLGEFVKADRQQFFLYQRIPFDLLNHVNQISEESETPLKITYVRCNHREQETATKRSLAIIDMEPVAKQVLLTDLQNFLDKDTKLFYRANGTPHRRGYLLYGPPETGKTSLSQVIASEYDVELFVIDLTGMDDTNLQSIFKELPSRCVVLMEDIDAAGIVRENVMKAKARSRHHENIVNYDDNEEQYSEDDDNDDDCYTVEPSAA